jgi:hypothetical protein
MKKLTLLALVVAAFALPIRYAEAATVTCPDPVPTDFGKVTLVTDPVSSCYDFGKGDVDLSPLTLLDKTGETNLLEGALTINETSEGQGTFSVDATLTSGYTNLVLAIKGGNLDGLQWGAFSLAALDGTWSLQDASDKYKGLSGAELWGSPIPVPAAFWLFGTALIGFIGFSRRTKV